MTNIIVLSVLGSIASLAMFLTGTALCIVQFKRKRSLMVPIVNIIYALIMTILFYKITVGPLIYEGLPRLIVCQIIDLYQLNHGEVTTHDIARVVDNSINRFEKGMWDTPIITMTNNEVNITIPTVMTMRNVLNRDNAIACISNEFGAPGEDPHIPKIVITLLLPHD